MAIQQSETPHLQIIVRRLLLIVLLAAATAGCSKDDGPAQHIASNAAEVVLRYEAGAEASLSLIHI